MARVIHTDDPLETLRLEDGAGAVVHVAPARGGMATRFAVSGVPVLFMDDATLADPGKSVRGGIPILFPVSGKLPGETYQLGAEAGAETGPPRTFAMKQHGFARNLPWKLVDESTGDGASVTLALESTEATRAQYPFDFALRFTYRLRAGALAVEQHFENRGSSPMPVLSGLHPYFFVPDASKAGVRLDTDATRAKDNRTGQEGPLPSPIDLVDREVDLFLLDHHPRETVLHRPGLPGVRIAFGPDQKLLVVWTLPGCHFVCVEPWRGMASDFPGNAPVIPPGATHSTTLTLSLTA